MSPNNVGIAVYDPGGRLIWQKSINELLPKQSGLFSLGIHVSRWYSDQLFHQGTGLHDAFLEFILVSQDVLRVAVANGESTLQTVADSVFFTQPDSALARASYRNRTGDGVQALAILETVHARYPEHYAAAKALSKHYERDQRYEEAIRVLEKTAKYLPLNTSDRDTSANHFFSQSPESFHSRLAGLYIKNGQIEDARELLAQLYTLAPFVVTVVCDYADVLFTLGDSGEAERIFNRLYEQMLERFRQHPTYLPLFQGDVERMNLVLVKHQRTELAESYLAGLEKLEGNDLDSWYLTKRGDSYAKSEDFPRAIGYYERAAAKSVNGEPEFKLAELYRKQSSTSENNLERAVHWYRRAATKTRRPSSAQRLTPELALCYLLRVEQTSFQDFQESLHWCRQSAAHGAGEGQFWTAIYIGDKGMKQYSPAEARALLLAAREQNRPGGGGAPDAPHNSFHPKGLLKEHFLWAAETLTGPAFQDDPVASYTLGRMYNLGWGVEKDVATAESWFQKSADAGYPSAMLELGHIYNKKNPYTNRSDYLSNKTRSIHWYEQAAAHGEEWGHYYVAKMVMHDYSGESDWSRARRELDLFSKLYMEKQRIRHERYKRQYFVSGPGSRNPADHLYSRLEELEAGTIR